MPWYVTNWAWNAMYRRLKRVVFRREAEVRGKCLCCGRCCREIVLHVGGRWIRSKRQFERDKAKDGDLERFFIKGKDEDGRIIFGCSWLTEEGLCRDYEHRLDLCRNHPGVSLYYSGVVLPRYCGYTLKGPGPGNLFGKLLPGRPGPSFQAALDSARKADGHTKEKNDT